ncbi:MAG: hypothetical protein JKY82_03195 [Rhizobiaceae bacterium]|nr:hypothetical protein [Rhizobiaceae bacterium]
MATSNNNRPKNPSSVRRTARTAKTSKTIDLEVNKEKSTPDGKTPSANKAASSIPATGTKTGSKAATDTATTSKTKPASTTTRSSTDKPDVKQPDSKTTPAKTETGKSSGNMGGMVLSAVFGGLITIGGLGAVGQMDSADRLPLIGSIFAKSGGAEIDLSNLAERDAVAAIRSEMQTEIDGLKAQLKTVGTTDLSAIEARIAGLEQNSGPKTTIDDGTADRILEVGKKAQANGDELKSIVTQISQLQEKLAQSGQGQDDDNVVAQLGLQTSELAERIGELENQIKTELLAKIETATKIAESAKISEKIARSVAVSALQTSIEQNTPYLNALMSIETLSGSNDEIDRLKQLATSGDVPNLQALHLQFQSLASGLIPVAEGENNASVLDRLMNSAKSLVKIRSSEPISGNSAEAVVSRIDEQLNSGNLAGVVEEWNGLPDQSKVVGAGWIKAVKLRMETNGLLQQVLEQASKG